MASIAAGSRKFSLKLQKALDDCTNVQYIRSYHDRYTVTTSPTGVGRQPLRPAHFAGPARAAAAKMMEMAGENRMRARTEQWKYGRCPKWNALAGVCWCIAAIIIFVPTVGVVSALSAVVM